MSKFKIEKNVPIPKRKGNPTGRTAQWDSILQQMEKGDSIGGLNVKDKCSIMMYSKKKRIHLISRREEGQTDAEGKPTYRIWYQGEGIYQTDDSKRADIEAHASSLPTDILRQAEEHEENKNIVEDVYTIQKTINEEMSLAKKREKK